MKIAVLLSGGVDSSVALRLLKDQGHELIAFYLKIWLQDEFSFLGECPWEEDLKFVKAVCEQSQIPLEILSLQTEYWESVVTYTIEEIKAGRTPNPDMFCNSLINLDTGNKMGHHNGYYFYTIGQRSGLKLSGGPWFVVGKDIKRNIIYISRENKSLREKNEFLVGKFNWISGSKPENEKLEVKIRHGAKKFECKISFNDDDSALVNMNEADSGIAPGQFAVFYDNDLCLGGGVIL